MNTPNFRLILSLVTVPGGRVSLPLHLCQRARTDPIGPPLVTCPALGMGKGLVEPWLQIHPSARIQATVIGHLAKTT